LTTTEVEDTVTKEGVKQMLIAFDQTRVDPTMAAAIVSLSLKDPQNSKFTGLRLI